MFRKILGERRLFAVGALLIVACSSGLSDDGTTEPEADPQAQGGTSGVGGVGPRSDAASSGAGLAPKRGSGGVSGNQDPKADPVAGGVANHANEPSGEGLGDGGGEADDETLELPPWSPDDLAPLAWFFASSTDVGVNGGGWYWSDHRGNGPAITQSFLQAAPQLVTSVWNANHMSVRFNGGALATLNAWSQPPAGTNEGFTLLAVMRSAVAHSGAVASWWSATGDGAWASVRSTSGLTLLEVARLDDYSTGQMHVGDQDLGTGPRVVAWRFSPGTQTMKLTVDGANFTSSTQSPLGVLETMQLIVGARSTLPTGQFQGDVSELVIVGSDISDEDVQDFTEYARETWDLPTSTNSGPCIKADDGQPSPDTIRCDDGDPATVGDHCSLGSCAGVVPGAGSPKELSPIAWYYAAPSEVVITDGGVSHWFDRTLERRDLAQAFYVARPTFAPSGWNGAKPTLTFDGNDTLKRHGWSGAPAGTETDFSVLAVLRPTSQNGAVAAWWNSMANGRVQCQVKTSGSRFLDLLRTNDAGTTNEFLGDVAVETARHVVVWRHADGVMKLTVDGLTRTQAQPAPGTMSPELFLVGATAPGTGLFSGDISELAVIPRGISDNEVARFNEYAVDEWGGLTLACTPDCVGKPAGAANGCGGSCDAGNGNAGTDCTTSADCLAGLACIDGVCRCLPSCGAKMCGDAPADGCGGTCLSYCGDREAGCNADYQCPVGSVCMPGAGPRIGLGPGVNICLPAECADPVPDLSHCGTIEDTCGLCPVCREENPCANTPCGPDPFGCGVDCDQVSGGCSEGSCVAGTCLIDSAGSVEIPNPGGGSPIVVAPLPPESTPEVGAMSGEFSVSDRGTAVYDIPILVPPGRAGMQPEIGFRYASTSENGQLGVGWSLAGLSMITRCAKTKAVDGWPSPVRMDDDDALCIDGKRMHFYDEDSDAGGDWYGTEPTDFSRILGVGSLGHGYDHFKVWTKSGRILYYGTTENSRVARVGEGTVRSWHLSRVEDRAGNYMRINYTSVGAYLYPPIDAPQTALPNICTLAVEQDGPIPPECENPEINLASIQYGGFSNAGISVGHTRTVEFKYRGRTDRIDGYRPGGGRVTRTTLLESVTTYVRERPVRTYRLGYATSSNGLSELREISECARDAAGQACKPPTTFEYHQPAPFGEVLGFDGLHPAGTGWEPRLFGDFDGNGLLDILSHTEEGAGQEVDWFMIRSTEVGGAAFEFVQVPLPSNTANPIVFSMAGDAKDDIFAGKPLLSSLAGGAYAKYYRSVGITDVPIPGLPSALDLEEGRAGLGITGLVLPQWAHLDDVDGDQFPDILYCKTDHTWAYERMVVGVPWPFGGTPVGGTLGIAGDAGQICRFAGQVDFDGDGLPNPLVPAAPPEGEFKSLYAAIPSGPAENAWKHTGLPSWAGEGTEPGELYARADFNGDGLQDVYAHVDYSVRAYLNKGTGKFVPLAEIPAPPLLVRGVYMLDANSDGYDDLVVLRPAPDLAYKISYGGARPLEVVEDFPLQDSLSDWTAVDINGDSSADLIRNSGRFEVRLGDGARANLLTRVTDGMGKQYTIRYDAEGQWGPTYEMGEVCPYPTKCVRDPGPLVSEYAIAQVKGLGLPVEPPVGTEFKQRRFVFTYGDAKSDTRGWGWLGFGRRTIWEYDGANQFIRQYRLAYHNGPNEISGGSYPPRFVFAGLVDESVTVSAADVSPIDGPHASIREERVSNHYSKKTSVDVNPFEFPFLDSRTTQISELYQNTTNGAIVNSRVLWTTLETFDVDEFGNPVEYDRASAKGVGGVILETHSTNTFYDIRQDDWLISLVSRVEDTDSLAGGSGAQTRTSEFTYDARGLLSTETREPEDVPESDYYRLVTTFTRSPSSLWNVDTVVLNDADASTPQRMTALDYDDDKIFVERETRQVETDAGLVDHVNQFTYDERHGLVSTFVNPSYVTTRLAYDGFGRVRRQEHAGEVTTIAYHTAIKRPPFVRAVLQTDTHTLTPHEGGTLSRTDSVEVDSFGRTVRTQTSAPVPLHQAMSYDLAGRVASVSKPQPAATTTSQANPATSYAYDSRQRLIRETYPDGTFSSFDYAVTHGGDDGYLGIGFTSPFAVSYLRTTDPNGNVTLHASDIRKNLVANYFNELADVTTYDYAAYNVLFRMTDAAGNARLSESDRYGRIDYVFDLDRGPSETRFTAFGEAAAITTADNLTTTSTYDALGRIRTRQNDVDGVVEWSYDRGPDDNLNDIGSLVEVVRHQEGHSERYRYEPYQGINNRGLVEEVTRRVRTLKNPNGQAIVRSYSTRFERDPGSGLVTVARLPEAGSSQSSPVLNLVYGYDEQGYLDTISSADALEGSQEPLYLWQRRQVYSGELVSEFALGGHVAGGGAIRGKVDFDPLSDEVLGLQYTRFDDPAAIIDGATYTYDDNGNMETIERHVGNDDLYLYDSLDRLKHVVTLGGLSRDISYGYDSIGNIDTVEDSVTGTKTYDYDHGTGWWPHAVRTAGDYEFDYTPRGAVLTRTNVATDTQQTFDYMGAFDLPRRIETSDAEGITTTELEYSPLGDRVIKRTRASDDTILSEVQYVGDDLEIHHRSDDSYEYVYNIFAGAAQIGRITLVEQTPGGALSDSTVEFLLTDVLGTPRTVAGSNGGALRHQSAAPTPFGQMSPPIGPGFTGHRHDVDLELIDMRGRLYDPGVGRFMQADPIIPNPYFSEALNPYTYVFNSPMNWTDPSGLNPCGWDGPCSYDPDYGWMPEVTIRGPSAPPSAPPNNGGYDPTYGYGPTNEHGGRGGPTYPTGGGQWGPGNSPGDISPERRNEICAGQTGWPCQSPGSDSNVELLSRPEFRITDTSETFETGLDIVLFFTPGGGLSTGAKIASGVGRALKRWVTREVAKEAAEGAAKETARSGAHYIRNVICFPPGTLVLMADGTTKAIEHVEEGDWVLAADPEQTEEAVARRVVATIENKTQRLFSVEFDADGDGLSDGSFEVTGEHPIWTQNSGWTDAEDLQPGDELRTHDGATTEVIAVSPHPVSSGTYNLSVEGIHTFFIVADGVSVLVHNQPHIHSVAPDWAIKGAHVTTSNGIELGIRGGGGGIKIVPIFSRDATNPGLRAAIKEVETALTNPTWRAKLLDQTRKATTMLGKGTLLERAGSGGTRALEVVLERWCR